MPQIPISNRQVRQQTTSLSGLNIKTPLTGVTPGATQAAAGLINESISVFEKMKNDAEEVELGAFKAELRKKQDELVHDKETGFYRRRGKDTTMSYDQYSGDYKKFIEEKVKGLGSDSLKKKASLIAADYELDYDRQLNDHTAKEMERYDDEQTEVNLEAIRNHAVLNYKEMGRSSSKIRESLDDQDAQIEMYAKRKGMSPEQVADLKLKKKSQLHYGVVNQALSNEEDQLAKDYYNEAKKNGEIDADTAAKLDQIIENSSLRGNAQRLTSNILSKNETIGAAMEEVYKIKDPKLQDEVRSRVRERWEENKYIQKEQDRTEFESVVADLEKFKSLDHLSEEERLRIPEKKKKLLDRAKRVISKGGDFNTDPEVYQDLMLMASRPETRSAFLQTDINEHLVELSTADRHKLIGMQKDIREGKGTKHQDEFGQFLSDVQTINGTMDELEIKDKAERAKFTRLVQERAINWQKTNNKKNIPQDELRKIADSFGAEVKVKGFFWDSKKKLYEVTPTDEVVVPPEFIEEVKKRYSALGKPYDDSKARILYQKQLNRK